MPSRLWRNWLRRLSPQIVQAHEGYALWAATYPARPHNPLMEVEQAMVAPILAEVPARSALDVGTGTGRNLTLLRANGVPRVVGIDLSWAMLNRCERSHRRVCGDAGQLPFAARSFDLVCSSLMLGDVRDLSVWTAEAARVLTPGGHLVYSDFHPSWSARKWKRTFRIADGRRFELNYFSHPIDDHLASLEAQGFTIRTIREPRVAGRAEPVVVVFHAIRSGAAPRRPRHETSGLALAGIPEVVCPE